MDVWEMPETAEKVGWHACIQCWDPDEGYFPVGLWWDGECWRYEPTGGQVLTQVSCVPGEPFPSQEAAKAVAYEHDPGY